MFPLLALFPSTEYCCTQFRISRMTSWSLERDGQEITDQFQFPFENLKKNTAVISKPGINSVFAR